MLIEIDHPVPTEKAQESELAYLQPDPLKEHDWGTKGWCSDPFSLLPSLSFCIYHTGSFWREMPGTSPLSSQPGRQKNWIGPKKSQGFLPTTAPAFRLYCHCIWNHQWAVWSTVRNLEKKQVTCAKSFFQSHVPIFLPLRDNCTIHFLGRCYGRNKNRVERRSWNLHHFGVNKGLWGTNPSNSITFQSVWTTVWAQ